MVAEPARLPAASSQRAPRAPGHLKEAGRALWRDLAGVYAFEGHHLAILQAACEAADRSAEARAAIERDGAYVAGRFGLRAHPALAVERDSRIALYRGLRELGLDLVEASRPPTRWRP